MPSDVTLWGALLAGLLSFVSPCVLPLVPPYLCYVTGLSLDEVVGDQSDRRIRRIVLQSSLAFVLGFSTVFVLLGATASVLGRLVARHQDVLSIFAGLVIIVMGLHFLGVFRIGFMQREARLRVERQPAGIVGAYVLGLAFAFGWTPCIGPVLAAILAVAGSTDTVGRGAGLLAIYSLGLGIPFMIAAGFAEGFVLMLKRFRRHMPLVEKAMGVFLVFAGFMFLTGQMTRISFWLLEAFPGLQTIG
ncbi:cytochrome c biogenesis protein CcdA [Kaistia dalseonensis]|uniref:Cytochrome c-type biogenesis protein n=1 Tax=Kaistia dalseonensis TaxID=410840 RepID=A0ABU0H5F7_9HYPH|nr:cytochrome c biogenesis protein CcdA [Kaistia dalseonensis]MCX5494160.1 cytochrome c biogenesis protein CcdA [Kaistia dalseonensis]MDQ0436739.1 cytochrome c-type biogenesis protein [Kaistia dalseonensis]